MNSKFLFVILRKYYVWKKFEEFLEERFVDEFFYVFGRFFIVVVLNLYWENKFFEDIWMFIMSKLLFLCV